MIIMHLAGSPGGYFAFLKDCLKEWSKKLECTLSSTTEWFSVECRKTKTKVITLANHKEHTQYSEPIKTRTNYR